MIPSETSIVWYCWLSRKIETLQKIQNFGAKCLPPVVQVAFWMSSKAIYDFTIMNSIQNCFARWRSSKIFTNYVGLSASQWDLPVVCHLPMNRYWVNKGKYHIWNIEGIGTQILFLQIGLSFEVNQEWHTVYRKNLGSLPKGQDVQVSQERKIKMASLAFQRPPL